MINLLPGELKREIRAGRGNVLLLRYNILMILIVGFLGMFFSVCLYLLSTSEQLATTTISDNAKKEASSYSDIKLKSDTFRAQLSEAKSVLDSNVSYSSAVLSIANLVPAGVILDDITLDETSFSQPIVLSARVKGRQEALNLRSSFQNSPKFSNVSLGSSITKSGDATYPYSINLTVNINKEPAQ